MEKSKDPPPYVSREYPPPPQVLPQGAHVLPQGQQALPQGQVLPQSTIIVANVPSTSTGTTVIVAQNVQYGPTSQQTICPHCHSHILTRVQAEATTRTHFYAGLLCLLLLWPCVILPYVMSSCKNRNHYCPSCGAFLGTYN